MQSRLIELEAKARDLEDSIQYASRLQQAILPNPDLFREAFIDAFVMHRVRDIVGGDFYWLFKHESQVYFAVGDCTGHGVPGAMINMAGIAILRQVIRTNGISDPASILASLDRELSALFNEHLTTGHASDGMDIALCRFDLRKGHGSFCGAGRPLLVVREGELVEYNSGMFGVGHLQGWEKKFQAQTFELCPGDRYYLFSDGYTDQFGGEKVKKFNRKRLRKLILAVQGMPMERQQKELELAFDTWKGKQEQIDDVCVLGIQL